MRDFRYCDIWKIPTLISLIAFAVSFWGAIWLPSNLIFVKIMFSLFPVLVLTVILLAYFEDDKRRIFGEKRQPSDTD